MIRRLNTHRAHLVNLNTELVKETFDIWRQWREILAHSNKQ